VIGTRLSTRKAVVLSKGDLAQAVRASFAIPLIFSPGIIGADVLMDGGVSDNIPVAAARAMGAERLIISTLPSSSVKDDLLGDPLKVALQLTDYLFLNDTTGFQPQDLIVRNRTADVNSLDFSTATTDSLILSGMREARATFAKAGCVQTMRGAAERGHIPNTVVPTTLVALRVSSPRLLEEQTLRNALGVRPGRRFREDSLRNRLLQLGTADDYRALWLTPSGQDTSVTFNVTPVYGAKQAFVVGFAYDNDLGGRMWGAAAWRDLFRASVEGATLFDIGKYRQEFRAGLLRRIPVLQRAAPFLATLRLVNEDVRIFTDSSELTPVSTREVEVAAGVSGRLPAGFALGVTPSFRAYHSRGFADVGAVGLSFRLTHGGSFFTAPTRLEADVNTRFQRVHFETRPSWQFGTLEVVPRARVSWSRLAPLQDQYFLGGYDGFAGLRTTERRGEQEAMAGLALKRQAFGPVRAIGEFMVGAIGAGTGFLRRVPDTYYGQIISGYRLGGEMRAGPVDVTFARGFNSVRGDVWFIRLGQWF
jgi:NTE family protein